MIKTTITLVAGAALGSIVTYILTKKYYETLIQVEIDSVKETFSNREWSPEDEATPEEGKKFSDEKPALSEYAKILSTEGYIITEEEARREKGENPIVKPYVIKPDDYGDQDGYDCESLIYFADGVLTDDFLNPIEDVEGLVGEDSLTHFGEYEDDSVFVRNDHMKTDYEILKDLRDFYDMVEPGPDPEE